MCKVWMSVRSIGLLVFTLLCVSETAYSDEKLSTSATTDQLLIAYARAAGLAPLGSRGTELRVWTTDVMLGNVWGFAISKDGIVRCTTLQRTDGSVDTVKSARCRRPTGFHRAREALALLPELFKLDGKELECGVQDGGSVLLEGRDSNGRFVFSSDNPSFCQDPGSVLVTKLLGILGD